ncbi:MAG: PAS domain-containing protein [Acidobacteria bacterium]|nr:PAS domain-containing protein [Acidobacteriota bacterium]
MNGPLSAALPAALDLAVFVERDDAGFDALEPLPAWAGAALPLERPLRLGACFLFLDTFLLDAADFWAERRPGVLRSGPWTEAGRDGVEQTFEALALFHADRRVLILERLGEEFQQLQQSLQTAREAALHAQRIGLLAVALGARGVNARPLGTVAETVLLLEPGGDYRELVEPRPPEGPYRLADWLPAAAVSALRERIGTCVRQRRSQQVSYTLETPEGPRAFEARLLPFNDDQALAVLRDVTQRVEAEQELERRAQRLRRLEDDLALLLDELDVGAIVLDEEGRCAFASQAAGRILAAPIEALRARPWPEIFAESPVERRELLAWAKRPAAQRGRSPLLSPAGLHLELDLREDPRNPARGLLFLYDVTEVQALRRRLDETARFGEIVGASPVMGDVYRLIEDFAPMPTTVLIEGETGVGKELAARALHQRSPRHAGPFVAVNCAGLPESLAAGQLFGHKRGAFTGAIQDQRGLFEAANGGTLFLDEIGDLPPAVQTTLLRVIQEREILRLGETTPRKIDVRLLTATHRNLETEVREGRFRSDLLYRIRVARIRVPPLRERVGDIPLLAAKFLQEFRGLTGKPLRGFSNEVLRLFAAHSWPGNVRELRSVVEYGAIRARTAEVGLADLPPEMHAEAAAPAPDPSRVQAAPDLPLAAAGGDGDESERYRGAIERAGGNRTKAARLLGISRATFYRRLAQLGIEPQQD